MASFINKRQQARNERALQDLIRNVPGNERCADCMARNPGWASWSLGIFLCMRCASLHRKLGTHISKIKSLSMDSWSADQVENMKLTGNFSSNQVYNPRNIKPSIPIDADEVDGTMERFIRQKYQQRNLGVETTRSVNTNTTGSTNSNDDPPPPLPPKPTSRFGSGLRAASSTFPMSLSRMKSHPSLPVEERRAARIHATMIEDPNSNLELKIAALKDMGFPDEQRNAAILKGLNGNVEKAVASLVRLGEGGRSARDNVRDQAIEARASATSAMHLQHADQLSNSQQPNQSNISQVPLGLATTTQSQNRVVSPGNTSNPFDSSVQTQPVPQNLGQKFQALQISQQPLFPNNTGGWVGHDPRQNFQSNPFFKTFTPPISPSPYQFTSTITQDPMFFTSSSEIQPSNGNPFIVSSQANTVAASNPFMAPLAQSLSYPTIVQQERAPPVPAIPSWVPQQQQQQLSPQAYSSSDNATSSQNPFFNQTQLQPRMQTEWQNTHALEQNFALQSAFPVHLQQNYPHQPLIPQQTGRYDKNSILALYDYPQLAPPRPSSKVQENVDQKNGLPNPITLQQRSVTMPNLPNSGGEATFSPTATSKAIMTGSKNPFAIANSLVSPVNAAQAAVNDNLRNLSRDSVDFAGLSGRHSPDAFAGLSARYG